MPLGEGFTAGFNNHSPIYSQIIRLFSRSFARGEIQTGERIPSIRDMAVQLKVNANTMQRVYQEMERSGLITGKRGTGYFFTEDAGMIERIRNAMAREAIDNFLEEMRALGFSDAQVLHEISATMKGGGTDDSLDPGQSH